MNTLLRCSSEQVAHSPGQCRPLWWCSESQMSRSRWRNTDLAMLFTISSLKETNVTKTSQSLNKSGQGPESLGNHGHILGKGMRHHPERFLHHQANVL
jgi:hypothetical protein